MKTFIGKKLGMTQIFSENGDMLAVNLVLCEPMIVLRRKTQVKDGYDALVVGCFKTGRKKIKPVTGQFRGLGNYQHIKEIPLPISGKEYKAGDIIDISLFDGETNIDVQGISKGKGFAGTIKRHNFSRGPMTHGHDHHRAPGSIGAGTTPGRVFKNTRMGGRMGNKTVSVIAQKVVKIDKENNLLLLEGSIPGWRNSLIIIKETTHN